MYEARDQTDRQIFMSDTKYRTLRELKAVRYNPLYWLFVVPFAGLLLVGKWGHALYGQGGAVRDDETALEYEVHASPLAPSARTMGIDRDDGSSF